VDKEFSFDEWEKTLPEKLVSDPLCQTICYRLAMYLYDLAWRDCVALKQDFRGNQIVSQLIRSSGSICANIEEAYGRGLGTADNVRIMRIALGEARETQGWYFRSRHILPKELIERRIDIVDQVIRLLVNRFPEAAKQLLLANRNSLFAIRHLSFEL
jgi:four helix bundle protein